MWKEARKGDFCPPALPGRPRGNCHPKGLGAVVKSDSSRVYADSRDVAAFFEKRHKHVLRDIRSLIEKEPPLGMRNFEQTPLVDSQNGQEYAFYEMDRDGFTLLAMGFQMGDCRRRGNRFSRHRSRQFRGMFSV